MVEPVRIGDATLYCGDCLEIMPTLGEVDGVVTDPPYGIEHIVGGYGRIVRLIKNDVDLSVTTTALKIINNVQSNIWVMVFYSPRNTATFYREIICGDYVGEIVWDKKAPGLGEGLRYQHENIALFKIGVPDKLEPMFSVLSSYRVGVVHPHEKPLPLMRRLCEIMPAATILDPFMGSGTTGVACVKLGRKFIGIELDHQYFDIACQRIEEAYAQPDMFVEPPSRAEQLVIEGVT